MKYRDDYAAAGVPMLPVVRNPKIVGAQILLYSWAMVTSSLLLIPAANMGVIYTATAALFGIWFTFEATVLYRQSKNGHPESPMRLFHGSISYLTVLFLAVAIDPILHFPLF
jgi:protoheme IX farnesyltransferase